MVNAIYEWMARGMVATMAEVPENEVRWALRLAADAINRSSENFARAVVSNDPTLSNGI